MEQDREQTQNEELRTPRSTNETHFSHPAYEMRPTDLAAAHHYDKVISVITKDPEQRTNTDIYQIKSWFQKKSDLFNQLNDEIITDLIKNCTFTTVDRDYVIIKQGDKGDCFFIILNGSVAIHINTTFGLDDDRQETSEKEESTEETSQSKDSHSTVKSKEHKDGAKPKELDRSKFGNYVGKIESGKSFGELALINTDCVRNATIIADEDTDLIIIDRDLYNRCIKSFHAKEFADRKRFVENNPLFDRWHPKYKKQMAMSLRKEKLKFESIVVKQGAQFDGLRFILSGQTKMISDPKMHSLQYPNFYPLPDVEDLEKVEARESLRRELSMNNKMDNRYRELPKPVTAVKDTGQTGKRSPKPHRHIELCLIGTEEIVGDMEVAMDLNTYSYTVTCIEETEIYVLDQKNYERLIEKRNPQCIDMIRQSVLEKYSLRMSWGQDKQELKLFRYLLYKIEESERKKILKREEILRNEKDNDRVDEWMSSSLNKGPLINMFGPGSVFYAIRMKAKQREMEKLSFRARADKRRGIQTNRRSPKPIVVLQNKYPVQGASPVDFVANSFKGKYDPASGAYDFLNEDEVDYGTPDGVSRSQLVCDKGRKAHPSVKDTSPDTDFNDWESSDANLCQIETRLQKWYKNMGDEGNKDALSVVKLRRYQAEDPGKPPRPGKKIFIRTKSRNTATYLDNLRETVDDDQHIARMCSDLIENISTAPPRVKCLSAPPGINRRDCWSATTTTERPVSSYRSVFTPTICLRRKRPQSAHQYTAQEYEALKAEMKRRQRTYKSMYYGERPMSAYY